MSRSPITEPFPDFDESVLAAFFSPIMQERRDRGASRTRSLDPMP
jgi:hypothetical protein